MVIKIEQPSTSFTASEWYEYFFKRKKKNTKQICILRECFKNFELNFPFLDESQHWGKVYQLLGIPNLFGKVYKSKLREMYLKERKNKFNRVKVDIKKIKKKESKDYRAIVRRNRNIRNDQKQSDVENKENNLTVGNELNFTTGENIFDSEKKKVRFNNVQVLCYDISTSSESDLDYIPTLSFRKPKVINNITETPKHKPYFFRLNDSQSTESVSDNEGNDHDTGIISQASSEDAQENSQVENHSITCTAQEKTNESPLDNIVFNNINISETLDEPRNESDEEFSDIAENDHDTGIISPLPCSMENMNENSSDNVSQGDEARIISSDSSSEEEDIVCNSGDDVYYTSREIQLARESRKRKPQELKAFNDSGNIKNQPDSITAAPEVVPSLAAEKKKNICTITNDGNSKEPNSYNLICNELTELNIETKQGTQRNKEINRETQKMKKYVEDEEVIKIINEPSRKESNTSIIMTSSDLEADELSSDSHEQNLANSSHLDAEELVIFIPSGNLVYPKIDHLEDYRLSSSSSSESIRTSLLQKDLGFGNISTSKIEEVKEQTSKDDFLAKRTENKSKLKLNNPSNDKENQNRSKLEINSNESINSTTNSPIVSLDLNKINHNNDIDEHNRDMSDDSSKIILNSEPSSSEYKEQTTKKTSTKRQPLKLLSNNSLLNRNLSKQVSQRNDAFRDKENTHSDNVSLKTDIKTTTANISDQPVSNEPSHETDKSSSLEILPPSDNSAKEAYILQNKIRSLYRNEDNSRNQNRTNMLKEFKEGKFLDSNTKENLSFNSSLGIEEVLRMEKDLFYKDKEMIIAKRDRSAEVTSKITISKKSPTMSVGSLSNESASQVDDIKEVYNCSQKQVTNKIIKRVRDTQCVETRSEIAGRNNNFLQPRPSFWKANVVQTSSYEIGNNGINDSELREFNSNIRNVSNITSSKTEHQLIYDKAAINQISRENSLTRKDVHSDNEENYADSSSVGDDESIELHKKMKRRRKKLTGVVKMKNVSNSSDISSEVTSDDMELIQKVENDNRMNRERMPFKRTTTTSKIVLCSHNVEEVKNNIKTVVVTNDNNSAAEQLDSTGGQPTTSNIGNKKKTSVVNQKISNISSDTSTTSEFISSALARRIFYLNK